MRRDVKIVRMINKTVLLLSGIPCDDWSRTTGLRRAKQRAIPMNSAENAVAVPIARQRSRKLHISWPLLMGMLGVLLPVATNRGLGDPDVYWHITAGRWMLEHGQVPSSDSFSFTMHGAIWVAQEWAAELLMAGCYLGVGWSGLVLLAAACFGATLAYLMRFLLARMAPLHALVLTSLAACMMLPSQAADPQALVWPLTVVWVGELVACSERNRAPPWWLLAVMLGWANLHGSFILGLALTIALAGDAVITARPALRFETAKSWTLFFLAAVGVALLNPRGYRLFLFPFHLLGMKSALALVAAWQPPNFLKPQMLGVWLVSIMALAFSGRVRLPAVRAALILVLVCMALQHSRNVALLGLLSPLLLASPMAAQWAGRAVTGRESPTLDRWFQALVPPGGLFAVWVGVLAAGTLSLAILNARGTHPPDVLTPRAAVDALLSRGPPGRIFNDFNFGGYLIFRGIPVFIDARVDMYGNAFSTETMEAQSLAPGADFEALLGKYRIDSILLEPGRPAVRLLDVMPKWRRVYADGTAVVYVRERT